MAKTKRARGRPRLHAEGMDTTIQIRCFSDDRDQWAKLAAGFGLDVGPWLRMLAMREVKKAR